MTTLSIDSTALGILIHLRHHLAPTHVNVQVVLKVAPHSADGEHDTDLGWLALPRLSEFDDQGIESHEQFGVACVVMFFIGHGGQPRALFLLDPMALFRRSPRCHASLRFAHHT
jgi:hypothetical protein